MKRVISFVLIVILTCTLVYAEGNTIAVQDAIDIALDNSASILKYSNTIKKLERNYTNAILSSRQLEDFLEMDSQLEKLSRKSTITPEEEAEYKMLRMILKKPMDSTQRLELERASVLSPKNVEYMLGINRRILKSTKDNIFISVHKGFNNIKKTEDSIMLKQALLSNLEGSYRSATAKYTQGKLSLNSLTLIELDLQKSRVELDKLKIEKKKNIIEINRTLGLPLDTTYDKYLASDVDKNIQIKDINEYISLALANRDEIKSAKQYVDIKEKEYNIAKKYYYSDTNINCRNAQVALDDAKKQLDSTEIDIQLQVMNAYSVFQSQLTSLEKSKISRDVNERIFRETQNKYKLGLTTELELSKANINYSQSQLTYLNTSRDTWLAKLNLDLACGIAVNNN